MYEFLRFLIFAGRCVQTVIRLSRLIHTQIEFEIRKKTTQNEFCCWIIQILYVKLNINVS